MGNLQNRTELLGNLGIPKFVSKFIPNISVRTAPLRDLTALNVDWH